jgi:hypothetical protein
LASLFVGHAAQKSKLHNLQYDEGGNHMAEAEVWQKSVFWWHFKERVHNHNIGGHK